MFIIHHVLLIQHQPNSEKNDEVAIAQISTANLPICVASARTVAANAPPQPQSPVPTPNWTRSASAPVSTRRPGRRAARALGSLCGFSFSPQVHNPARSQSQTTMAGGSLAPGQTGATPNQLKRKAPDSAAEDETEELESVEELESEVADLDRRTLEHLRRTAARLNDAAVSRLAALRPPVRLGTPLILPSYRARV